MSISQPYAVRGLVREDTQGCSSQGWGQLSERKVGIWQALESQSVRITEKVIKNVTKNFL